MKWCCFAAVAVLSLTTVVHAEPEPAAKKKSAVKEAPRRAEGPAAPAPEKSKLLSPVHDVTSKPEIKIEGPAVELFPNAVFGDRGRLGFSSQPDAEDSSRLNVGDGSWVSDAIVAGAAVGGFAALSALCSAISCRVPNAVTDWIPSPFRAEGQVIPQIRPTTRVPEQRRGLEPPRQRR